MKDVNDLRRALAERERFAPPVTNLHIGAPNQQPRRHGRQAALLLVAAAVVVIAVSTSVILTRTSTAPSVAPGDTSTAGHATTTATSQGGSKPNATGGAVPSTKQVTPEEQAPRSGSSTIVSDVEGTTWSQPADPRTKCGTRYTDLQPLSDLGLELVAISGSEYDNFTLRNTSKSPVSGITDIGVIYYLDDDGIVRMPGYVPEGMRGTVDVPVDQQVRLHVDTIASGTTDDPDSMCAGKDPRPGETYDAIALFAVATSSGTISYRTPVLTASVTDGGGVTVSK